MTRRLRLANLALPIVAGIVFGIVFIKMGRWRLEVLILVHALIDMTYESGRSRAQGTLVDTGLTSGSWKGT